MFGCENKNQTSLATPILESVSLGKIIFQPVNDAEYYVINKDGKEFYIDIKYNKDVSIVDGKIIYDASNLFSPGESCSIKIKAIASNRADSNYTESLAYTHFGSLPAVINLQINGKVLTWDAVENVSYYCLKVVRPSDKVLYDTSGRVLLNFDAESIEKSNLYEYKFYTNSFEFASILNTPGEYRFYIKAEQVVNGKINSTGYNSYLKYDHILTLDKPSQITVKKIDEKIHMLAVVDDKSNAITLTCGNYSKTIELNESNAYISKVDNIVDINLTDLLKSEDAHGNSADLTKYELFSFSVQSHCLVASGKTYLNSSAIVSNITFDHTKILETPTVSLNGNQLSWQVMDETNINAFKLTLVENGIVKTIDLNASKRSYELSQDFDAVAIESIGVGNFLSSPLSEFVYNPENSADVGDITFDYSNNNLTWSSIDDACYIVEIGNEHKVVSANSVQVWMNSNSAKLIVIKHGCKPKILSTRILNGGKLSTPTNVKFDAVNNYMLKFDSVDNAFGYNVYLRTEGETESIKVNKLFVENSIDLSQFITKSGEYNKYYVTVVAIANPFGDFIDSDASTEVEIAHIKRLAEPKPFIQNKIESPVVPNSSNGVDTYGLFFYGVDNAVAYEVLINYNRIVVPLDAVIYGNLYYYNITNYLVGANTYYIRIRALADTNSNTILDSDYYEYNYSITQQLDMVKNINVIDSEGSYILNFDTVENASGYEVRILKLNDSGYDEYLHSVGLSNNFIIVQPTDITEYLTLQGEYYIYMTAIAREGSLYAKSSESSECAIVSKLLSLKSPSNLTEENVSATEFWFKWTGDGNADYYLVSIADPNGILHTGLKTVDTQYNISEFLTVAGDYEFTVRAMSGKDSVEHQSSERAVKSYNYTLTLEQDFARYKIIYRGNSYDFNVSSGVELKNLLWYHIVHYAGADGLNLQLENKENKFYLTEGNVQTLLRIASELEKAGIYNFSADADWIKMTADIKDSIKTISSDPNWELFNTAMTECSGFDDYFVGTYRESLISFFSAVENSTVVTGNGENQLVATTTPMFSLIVEKVLSRYPDMNVLSEITVERKQSSQIFNLKYSNTLDGTKVQNTASADILEVDASYEYLDTFSQRGETSVFEIDYYQEVYVENTEDLLQAVLSKRKPVFSTKGLTAEAVYKNAKSVLRKIVNDKMTYQEKVLAIFEWLEYALNYDPNSTMVDLNGYIQNTVESVYGKYSEFYLESVFLNLNNTLVGNKDKYFYLGNKYATSASYAKAFSLLCAIEGIDSAVINIDFTNASKTYKHWYNKVYIEEESGLSDWYIVDIALSDNIIDFANAEKCYSVAGHSCFLISQANHKAQLRSRGMTVAGSGEGSEADYNKLVPETEYVCNKNSTYYADNSLIVTKESLNSMYDDDPYEEDKVFGLQFSSSKYGLTSYINYSLAKLVELYGNANDGELITLEINFPNSENNGSALTIDVIKSVYQSKQHKLNFVLTDDNIKLIKTNDSVIVCYVLTKTI